MFDSRYYVTLESDNNLSITVLSDANAPIIVGGHGGWEVVDRPKRVGMTRYRGKDPYRQDLNLRFEGVDDDISQEADIATLIRMAESPSVGTNPPIITATGLVLFSELPWTIENIDWSPDNVVWVVQGASRVRVRQVCTVHLLQFVDDNVIITAPTPAVANSPGKKEPSTHVAHGETLKEIAQDVYGNPNKWFTILLANPQLELMNLTSPRDIIPAGTVLTIPPLYGYSGAPFTVK